MADPGEGSRGSALPLFLDQTEAQRSPARVNSDKQHGPKSSDST